jgi:hypothetical protein
MVLYCMTWPHLWCDHMVNIYPHGDMVIYRVSTLFYTALTAVSGPVEHWLALESRILCGSCVTRDETYTVLTVVICEMQVTREGFASSYFAPKWKKILTMYAKLLLVCVTLVYSVGTISCTTKVDSEPKAVISDRCTAIAVGRKASKDGSTMTTHTADCAECDWRIAK